MKYSQIIIQIIVGYYLSPYPIRTSNAFHVDSTSPNYQHLNLRYQSRLKKTTNRAFHVENSYVHVVY